MSDSVKKENGFIGYEYKEIIAKRMLESVYADGYTNFGWTLEGTNATLQGLDTVAMKFKRDRKIRNKAELTRLQRQFEACVTEIESLERSKSLSASVAAYSLGLAGCAFMAGSVFSYLGGMLIPCVIFAVPGFLGWILPYFVFCGIRRRKTNSLNPVIDQKHDEIYSVCEKSNGLLQA